LQAREKIAGRGGAIGVDQAAEVAALERAVPSWQAELEAVQNRDVSYPSYYTQPFHAYDRGNLCWEAAFQVPPPPTIPLAVNLRIPGLVAVTSMTEK